MRGVTKKSPSLEAKILELINPTLELQHGCYDCGRSIRRALGWLSGAREPPQPPEGSVQRKLLIDVIRGVLIIEHAREAGALISAPLEPGETASSIPFFDWICRSEKWFGQLERMRRECERKLESEDYVSPRKKLRSGGKANPVKDRAVHAAYELLKHFSKTPPAVTVDGAWDRLALELYSRHGGRGDVFQAIRNYRTRNPWRGITFVCIAPFDEWGEDLWVWDDEEKVLRPAREGELC